MANDFSGDSNCKALWKVDDGALTVDSKGGNTLTNTSGVTADTSNYKEGDAAAYFGNLNAKLNIADANLDSGFPLKSGDTNKKISVCCWFRCTGFPASGQRMVWAKWADTNKRSLLLNVEYTGSEWQFSLYQGYNSGQNFEQKWHGTAITVNIWYHVGITYDDSDKSYKMRIWDDNAGALLGGAEVTGNFTNNISITDAGFSIGYSAYTAAGQRDEIAVFDDVLTSDEIDLIRAQTYTGSSSSVSSSSSSSSLSSSSLSSESSSSLSSSSSSSSVSSSSSFPGFTASIILDGDPVEDVTLYEQGELEMTGGNNSGERRPILSCAGSVRTVLWPFPVAVESGDTYNIYPGCDFRPDTCKNRFKDEDNWDGYPWCPPWEETAM